MNKDVETRVMEALGVLKMVDAQKALTTLLPVDTPNRTHLLHAVERVLQAEINGRRERRIKRRMDAAYFPDMPTLETFDFDFQPTLDRKHILDLANLAWVDRQEDLLFLGNAGVGKSHLAKAMCLIACKQERRVLYTTCATMMLDLHRSLADGGLNRRLKKYTAPELLLIDDLGYDPLEQEQAREAQLLHKVLSERLGKKSTIVTSNLDVDSWVQYLGHPQLTMALVDKLLFRAVAIKIDGPSYRLEAHKQRQKETKKEKKSRT